MDKINTSSIPGSSWINTDTIQGKKETIQQKATNLTTPDNSPIVLPNKTPFASRLIAEVAPEIGATVWLEPEYGFVGEISFPNGKTHLFRNTNFNVNPLGSVEIARDKGYSAVFLKRKWYQIAEGQTFFSEKMNAHIEVKRGIDDGWLFAEKLWLPVIVKPNNLSQWALVNKIDSKEEYYRVAQEIFERTNVMIVERFHIGLDYRVVIFDGEVISAYTRIPLNVTGNGKSTIAELLDGKQAQFIRAGRDTIIDREDSRIITKLEKQWYHFGSVLPKEKQIFLLDNANLSTGGDSIDVTQSIHPDLAQLAAKITADMGLRLCGVDFMTSDITKSLAENHDYIVLEINGAPGLDNYMSAGDEQLQNVKNMYKKILIALSKT